MGVRGESAQQVSVGERLGERGGGHRGRKVFHRQS